MEAHLNILEVSGAIVPNVQLALEGLQGGIICLLVSAAAGKHFWELLQLHFPCKKVNFGGPSAMNFGEQCCV